MGDFENDPLWESGVIEVRRLSQEHEVGARYWQKNRVLGITYPLILKIEEYVLDTRISFRSDNSAIIFSGSYLFAEEKNGTLLTITTKVKANTMPFKLFSSLFRKTITKTTHENFNTLKALLEKRAPRIQPET
jgi:hypothetical protein